MINGWLISEVTEALRKEWGFPARPGYFWPTGAPFMINSKGERPFIITCNQTKHEKALTGGEDVCFLPNLMGPPKEFPEEMQNFVWDARE